MSVLDQEMHKRGYDMGLTGSRYIKTGVRMIAARPDAERMFLTKELYPAIGREAGVGWQAVERAMRYAVKAAQPGRRVASELYDMAGVVRAYED